MTELFNLWPFGIIETATQRHLIEPYNIIGGLIRPIKLNTLNGNCIKPNGSEFNAAAVA